ncbi:MAG: precorrin-3B C(17)-methyltransferase [Deltaproteobacteria bacterium]|jgi:cobalt-factor III methyltransferase|nr:precorrin-3B C(17)-methyltransferase [Deltaproteobacteria bacterium]
MPTEGALFLVSVGPGFIDLVPERAKKALTRSEVIVGYDFYLRWVLPWIQNKQVETFPLTQERRRAERALELARQGKQVSLVSSGDIGIYGMATLALELLKEEDTFPVEVVPGISAANACAALLGAPLAHDFATLSLSDLLCPWEWIETRAQHLAQADLVIVLYNVQSRSRSQGVYRILEILQTFKSDETWCGIVRNAYREEQSVECCKLEELSHQQFDMFTTLVIGNRFTKPKRGFLFTPRGYVGWAEPSPSAQQAELPRKAVWVFAGTSDGNEIVHSLHQQGIPVIVSVATEQGAQTWDKQKIPLIWGSLGRERRHQVLNQHEASLLVDATHPYASRMTLQLQQLSVDLEISCLRYERPPTLVGDELCGDSIEKVTALALQHGKRILLATGSHQVAEFLRQDRHRQAEWFVRCAPTSESLRELEQAGVTLSQICAQQGPFSVEENHRLLERWKIEVLITKDSGKAGGYLEKYQAAKALGIPLIVLQRTRIQVAQSYSDISALLQRIQQVMDNND